MYAEEAKARPYAGTQDAIQRQLEIPHQLEMIERNLKGIAQGLDTLEGRLATSVLRGAAPVPGSIGGPAPSAVPSTPMGSRLQELASSLSLANERIQGMVGRLEA